MDKYPKEKTALEHCLDYREAMAEDEVAELAADELDALIHACHMLADVAQEELNLRQGREHSSR